MNYVYILRSGRWEAQLYIGASNNPQQRLIEHNQSKCRHTARLGPWTMVYVEVFSEKKLALKRERQLKGWSRGKKEALIARNVLELKRLAKRREW